MTGAFLLALKKPAGGVRPIACGDVIRHLSSKLMLGRVLPVVTPKLVPAQLGISVSAATEVLFHKVSDQIASALPDGCSFLLLDLKND